MDFLLHVLEKESKMNEIINLNLKELEEIILNYGESKFRAKQLFEWFHKKMIWNYDDMSNIPQKLRNSLKEDYPIKPLRIVEKRSSHIDYTIKYLFELPDSHIIESVFMCYKHGYSVCISSQVGCRMGCKFCASTLEGCVRNLMPSEMLGQIYAIEKDVDKRISNIVVMGSGEPLEELDVTLKFIELINDEKGQNIGSRHITLSTCGLVPQIKKLADQKLQINLAISLHAATDQKRRQIMPIAYRYSIAELIDACQYFIAKTNRRITFEYALIEGENDKAEDANQLGQLLKGLLCHINLIPINKIKERNYTSSKAVEPFIKILEQYKIPVTRRRTLGADIDAACGQLRRKYLKKRGD